MFSESDLKHVCKPAVYRRGLRMAREGTFVSRRTCTIVEGEIDLSARVDSHASWEVAHKTHAFLNEGADKLIYFECDCAASRTAEGPCDHVMALLIDFVHDPDAYEGFDKTRGVMTSQDVRRMLQLAMPAPASDLREAGTEEGPGTVRVEPTLVYDNGFCVRFRLFGAHGDYAVRSVADLADALEQRAFVSYGNRLAFEHTHEAFAPSSRGVADFVVRAMQARKALLAGGMAGRMRRLSSSAATMRELELTPPEVWELLSLCTDCGILFVDAGAPLPEARGARPMRIVDGDPSISFDVRREADGGFELVAPTNVRMASVAGRALAWDGRTLYACSEALSEHAALLACALSSTRKLTLSEADAATFCASVLPRLESVAHVDCDKRLDAYRPQPCELRFCLDFDERMGVVTCDAQAVYGDVALPLMQAARAEGQERAEKPVLRDVQAEARGREVVRRYFAVRDGRAFAQARGERLGVLVYEAANALGKVGTVLAYPAFRRLRSKARPVVRVGLSVRSNLLQVRTELDGLPSSELEGLLSSGRAGRRYHQLSDGSVVNMADVDLGQGLQLAEELGVDGLHVGEPVLIPAYRSMLLDGLVDDEDKDESYREYVDAIRAVDCASYEVPEPLDGVLRAYQQEGFRWLCGLSDLGLGGILADEMGLGKSVQLIAFVLAHAREVRSTGPVLVVCPSSLVYNWRAEFGKFAPMLRVRVVAGTPEERGVARDAGDADVLITSYDLLRRDVESYEGKPLWCVVLDEAQYIKNPTTQAAQAAKRLEASHRVALTGTPVENRLSELWSIFDFLMPGFFGSYVRFRERYERGIVEDESRTATRRLREAVRPFILRRTKADVATDLPDKIEQVVFAHMDGNQRVAYDAQAQEVRDRLGASNEPLGKVRFQILALLTRLRQICCDPQLLYPDADLRSCKTETILTLVDRVVDAGEKMLLFSQFTSYLSVIAARLDEQGVPYYTITGETPSARRLELVDAFNADDTPVFLISLKAGGTGLNLTGATVVVHADPWWNEAAQNQATDRAHRIGQTHEVTVYKVIVKDSIEERILDLQRTKAELADAVVQGDVTSGSLASLTREDLEELLA